MMFISTETIELRKKDGTYAYMRHVIENIGASH